MQFSRKLCQMMKITKGGYFQEFCQFKESLCITPDVRKSKFGEGFISILIESGQTSISLEGVIITIKNRAKELKKVVKRGL